MAMNMNREQKRMLRRAGYLDESGEPTQNGKGNRGRTATAAAPQREKSSPKQFLKETRGELRKVAWPTRAEVINYSIIVLVFLVVMTALVAAADWGFAKAVFWLFDIN
jgi:preprotein translocase subunit SecE